MQVVKNFFSFAELTNGRHQDYNTWHHLDHRPENLILPGVIWGERWVVTPECRAVAQVGDPRFEKFHYLTQYWFREPLAQSVEDWEKLADSSFHWGRRPDFGWAQRPYLGWADPVKGYAAPRVLIAPDVVPVRPHRGIHVTISSFRGAPADVNDALAWYDQKGIPQLLETPGVAGVWTFIETANAFTHAHREGNLTALRFRIAWLDEDPLAFCRATPDAGRMPAQASAATEDIAFSGPLYVIQPFAYDWFDR